MIECTPCNLKSEDKYIEMLLNQIRREVNDLKSDTTARLLVNAEDSEKSNLFRIYDQGVWVQTYQGVS